MTINIQRAIIAYIGSTDYVIFGKKISIFVPYLNIFVTNSMKKTFQT